MSVHGVARVLQRRLARYYALFPRERIRIFLFEDLEADPLALMRDLFTFLGVDHGFRPDVSRRHGTTGEVSNPVMRLLWRGTAGVRRAVRPLVPVGWRDRVFAWVTRDGVKAPLAPATRAHLMEQFRPDIVALQALIDRDLSAWLR